VSCTKTAEPIEGRTGSIVFASWRQCAHLANMTEHVLPIGPPGVDAALGQITLTTCCDVLCVCVPLYTGTQFSTIFSIFVR